MTIVVTYDRTNDRWVIRRDLKNVSSHDRKQDAVNKALRIARDGERVETEMKSGGRRVLEQGSLMGGSGGVLDRDPIF